LTSRWTTPRDRQRRLRRQGPRAAHAALQALAVHPLHDDVAEAAVLADLVDGDDARVLELGRGARLGQRRLARSAVRGPVHELHGHVTVEREMTRLVHAPHAAGADEALETAWA
jgi:hypothetical protein